MNDQKTGAETEAATPSHCITCEQCKELLIEFAHDELSRELYVTVSSHLSACSGCALQFCKLRADLDGIVHTYTESVPSRLRAAVRQRVLSELRTPWWHYLLRLFLHPIPAYSALGIAMIPALLWIGSSLQSSGRLDVRSEARAIRALTSSDIRVRDYDASRTLQPAETMY